MTAEQVWAGNGSNEVLLHLLQAFGGPGRTALGFTPAYSMHPIITTATGTRLGRRAARRGGRGAFDLDADDAAQQVRDADPDVVFLCSPNNPTGTALAARRRPGRVRRGTRRPGGRRRGLRRVRAPRHPQRPDPVRRAGPRLVVTRTMSKAFALAGAGWATWPPTRRSSTRLRLVRLPYHLPRPDPGGGARGAAAHAGPAGVRRRDQGPARPDRRRAGRRSGSTRSRATRTSSCSAAWTTRPRPGRVCSSSVSSSGTSGSPTICASPRGHRRRRRRSCAHWRV